MDQQQPAVRSMSSRTNRDSIFDRYGLLAGSIVCGGAMLMLASRLDLPSFAGRGGALFGQRWASVVLILLATLVFTLVGALFTRRVHTQGGLFVACVALASLSARLGPTRFALFDAASPRAYLRLSFELFTLFVVVGICWTVLGTLAGMGLVVSDRQAPLRKEDEEPLDQLLLATLASVIIMFIFVSMIAQTDSKPQTLAAAAIAGWAGAFGGRNFIAARSPAWFAVAPLVVGLLGYLSQYFSPSLWMIGDAQGIFAALARPTPLDYAGAGVAGSLLGYWMASRSRTVEEVSESDLLAPPTLPA